jgi:geranylgeranyl pyrophosphate synthase
VTLPVLYYLREHPDDERVAAVVRDGGDEALVQEVVAAIRKAGAVDQALDRARRFVTQSKAALDILPEGEPRNILRDLADYSVSRQK